MTDKLSEQLAKEIAEMSDEAVEVATKKYFMKNPCEEINIGVNELHYNPMEVDEGWEPPKPSHLTNNYLLDKVIEVENKLKEEQNDN